MTALIIDRPQQIRVGDWPECSPAPDELTVKISAAGICMGDLHIFNGRNPYAVYPCVAGHEMAGVVAGIGEGVNGFQVGDRVVVEPFLPCGRCYPCRIGKSNCCRNLSILGVHRPGGYAEVVVAPSHRLHRIPEGLDMVRASFAEPIAIAIQACRRAGLQHEDCLVLGCGPIGLSIVEVARARGANVFASDPDVGRLANALRLGAQPVPVGEELAAWVDQTTGGEGMPVVFEATGVPDAMSLGFKLTASGGRLVLLGLLPQGLHVTFDGLDLTRKEATILGSRASTGCFPEAMDLLANEGLLYPDVATVLPMWDGPEIFSKLSKDPGLLQKVVLVT